MAVSDNLFYAPDIGNTLLLPLQESQHCIKVLRMSEGDRIWVTDGKGSIFECEIVDAHPKHCLVAILNQEDTSRTRNYRIEIAFGPTKQNDRNEWFVEKATEIGIDKITPVLSDYSERKDIKQERLLKTAVSAMKQSQQYYLPEIHKITNFNDILNSSFEGRKFIAHCYDSPKEHLSKAYTKGENALLLIGPEGDFSEGEVRRAITNGFEPVSLGETRLRTETACLSAIHTIHVINNL